MTPCTALRWDLSSSGSGSSSSSRFAYTGIVGRHIFELLNLLRGGGGRASPGI